MEVGNLNDLLLQMYEDEREEIFNNTTNDYEEYLNYLRYLFGEDWEKFIYYGNYCIDYEFRYMMNFHDIAIFGRVIIEDFIYLNPTHYELCQIAKNFGDKFIGCKKKGNIYKLDFDADT